MLWLGRRGQQTTLYQPHHHKSTKITVDHTATVWHVLDLIHVTYWHNRSLRLWLTFPLKNATTLPFKELHQKGKITPMTNIHQLRKKIWYSLQYSILYWIHIDIVSKYFYHSHIDRFINFSTQNVCLSVQIQISQQAHHNLALKFEGWIIETVSWLVKILKEFFLPVNHAIESLVRIYPRTWFCQNSIMCIAATNLYE